VFIILVSPWIIWRMGSRAS